MSCCQNKPVSLNHLNDGEDHLADDIPIRNEDAIMPIAFPDITKTVTTGRSTRTRSDVTTTTVVVGPGG